MKPYLLLPTLFLACLLLDIGISPTSFAKVQAGAPASEEAAPIQPPQPPDNNPHPPITPEDKRRVAFAEQAIRLNLMQYCLPKAACYNSPSGYNEEVRSIQNNYGTVLEIRHAHIIPWSFQKFLEQRSQTNTNPNVIIEAQTVSGGMAPPQKPMAPMNAPQVAPDEYMIHAYVRFSNTGAWNHLDVIVTEDASGNLALRHFYTVPMPTEYHPLPPGVVC